MLCIVPYLIPHFLTYSSFQLIWNSHRKRSCRYSSWLSYSNHSFSRGAPIPELIQNFGYLGWLSRPCFSTHYCYKVIFNRFKDFSFMHFNWEVVFKFGDFVHLGFWVFLVYFSKVSVVVDQGSSLLIWVWSDLIVEFVKVIELVLQELFFREFDVSS